MWSVEPADFERGRDRCPVRGSLVLPADHIGRALNRSVDEYKCRSKSRTSADQLERNGRSPGVANDNSFAERQLIDHERGVFQELVHGISVVGLRSVRRAAGQAMPALVEGDDSPLRKGLGEPVPIPRVRAQAVEEEDRRQGLSAGVRSPLDVVEADAMSL